MTLYLAHTEDMLPEHSENVKVTMRANNGGLGFWNIGNCPSPDRAMDAWLKANCTDVYFSVYEAVRNADNSISHFELYAWFEDATQAMLFKLTWGGI